MEASLDGPPELARMFTFSRRCDKTAEAIFGKGRAGRKPDSKRWDGTRSIELALIYERCCYETKSDVDKATLIFSKHKEFQSAEALRRRLPEARQMLELWRDKIMDIEPPEGWHEDDGDDRRDDYGG